MPYKIIKSRYGCRVKSTRKGKGKAKAKAKFFSRHAIPCEKARAQEKLLRAVEHGWIPNQKRRTRRSN